VRCARAGSEGVLEPDQRRNLIAHAVIVEGEEQIGIHQQALQQIDLQPDAPLASLNDWREKLMLG